MKASTSEDQEKTEKQANDIFDKIYKKKISIPESIEMMSKFQKSENKEDKEVFACMITGLLEEQKYHNSYRLEHLKITQELYGHILNADILEGKPHQIFVNIVSEYIKKQKEDKFLKFAIETMKIMKSKLV